MSDQTNSFIGALLESNIWGKAGITATKATLTESAPAVVEEAETEDEVHMCPLCESNLQEPLDRENVELFVEALLMDDDDEVLAEDVDDEDVDDEDEE